MNKLFPIIYIYRKTWPYLWSIIWLIYNSLAYLNWFWKGIRQNHNWKNQERQQCSFQRGHIWTATCVFFIETLFYFIVTLELCVYPIKQLDCLPNRWICRLIWWFFFANRHSSVVCCSVTSRFYTNYCDKIRTHAFCFSCKTVLAWLMELRFDLTDVHFIMNWYCK